MNQGRNATVEDLRRSGVGPVRRIVEIVESDPDTQCLMEAISNPLCGANVLFVGTVRQFTGRVETAWLEYECYAAMATAEMERLIDECCLQFDCAGAGVVHRIGKVLPGQTSIAIAVSAPHRAAAFRAAEWLMNGVKSRVPIWKKDVRPDGSSHWVESLPTTSDSESSSD